MALGLSIALPTGVTATYWRITYAELDGLENRTIVNLSGYLSLESRNEGKKPVKSYRYLWQGVNNPVTPLIVVSGQTYAALYIKIKSEVPSLGSTNPALFSNATDI